MNQIIEINDFDEAYIGLNDLKIAFDLDFLFEFLSEACLNICQRFSMLIKLILDLEA